MGTLTAVRTGLKTRLATVSTLNAYRFMPKNPAFPCAVLDWPEEMNVQPAMDTARDITVPVVVGIELGADDESSDDLLCGFIESVPAAILADRTLSGAAQDLSFGPITFSRGPIDDGRIIQWFVVPVLVMT
jgi:hypothetical protein